MTLPITFNNVTFPAGYLGTDDGAPKSSFKVDNASTYSVTASGTINKIGDTISLTFGSDAPAGFAGQTITLTSTQYDNAGQILFSSPSAPPNATDEGTAWRYLLSNSQLHGKYLADGTTLDPNRTTFTADSSDTMLKDYNVAAAPCYASGTLIRTARGTVAVEDLVVGDLAVTASGAHRPIRWLGHRVTDCRRHPRPSEVMPVRIGAHAFGPNRPSRDLVVSPGHALCVDVVGEVLVPAIALVNDSTIRQEDVDRITYWHVELDSHDILLAENMPAESYLEMGNRGFFAQTAIVDLEASPEAPLRTHADFCRPFHADGAVVEAVRAQLTARARQLDWVHEHQPLANLHLVVDGEVLAPEIWDLQARFLVPADAKEAWLVSDTGTPARLGLGADQRALGVCVGRIVIDDGLDVCRTVAADDPALCVGFHDVEEGPQRWTCARARLPVSLWQGCRSSFFLRVDMARPALPRWIHAESARHGAGDLVALAS